MLTSEPAGVAFRHELARLAVEESIALNRRVDLHRKALAALCRSTRRRPRSGPARPPRRGGRRCRRGAAVRAGRGGRARRRSARTARRRRSTRARFDSANGLPPAERAELLERRSTECFLTDQYDEGIAALEEAARVPPGAGRQTREGDALRRLSEFLWCPGRTAESERAARDAVALLEGLPPGRELALAYANLASNCAMRVAVRGGDRLGPGARSSSRSGSATREIAVHALATIAGCAEATTRSSSRASSRAAARTRTSRSPGACHCVVGVGGRAIAAMRSRAGYLEPGIAYCSERGLELFRLYLLAYRARFELDQGRWTEAADSAATVLRIPRTSTTPRIIALVVLALVRARRGDPESLAAARRGVGAGGADRASCRGSARSRRREPRRRGSTATAMPSRRRPRARFRSPCERQSRWLAGELAAWRRRAGLDEETPVAAWRSRTRSSSPETGRGRPSCGRASAVPTRPRSHSRTPTRKSRCAVRLAELQRLDARPAAAIVARRLRERGARGLPARAASGDARRIRPA